MLWGRHSFSGTVRWLSHSAPSRALYSREFTERLGELGKDLILWLSVISCPVTEVRFFSLLKGKGAAFPFFCSLLQAKLRIKMTLPGLPSVTLHVSEEVLLCSEDKVKSVISIFILSWITPSPLHSLFVSAEGADPKISPPAFTFSPDAPIRHYSGCEVPTPARFSPLPFLSWETSLVLTNPAKHTSGCSCTWAEWDESTDVE